MGFDWKKALGGAAPAIAKALTGNFPGAAGDAVRALSRVLLGHEKGSVDDVAEVLAAGGSPELVEKIQAAEREFTLRLVDSVARLEEIEAGDRANARAREINTHDWTPRTIAIAYTLAYFILLGLLLSYPIPDANQRAFDIMLGMMTAGVTQVLTYYFGSSSSSRAKDMVIGRIAGR